MKTVSIIIYVDVREDAQIKKCIEGILLGSGLSVDKIQLILLGSMEVDADNWKQAAPDAEIIVKNTVGMEAPQAYNIGIRDAVGKYICFLLTSSYLENGALKSLVEQAERTGERLLSLSPRFSGEEGDLSVAYPVLSSESGVQNLREHPENVQLVLQAYLIDHSLLKDIWFREDIHEDAFYELLFELLLKNHESYYYEKNYAYNYTIALENAQKNCSYADYLWWYENSMNDFMLDFAQRKSNEMSGELPLFLQHSLYYLLCAKYYCNLDGQNRELLDKEAAERFFERSIELLSYIHYSLLFQTEAFWGMQIPEMLYMTFLKAAVKRIGGRSAVCMGETGELYFQVWEGEDTVLRTSLGLLKKRRLEIDAINYRDGRLELDGFYELGAILMPGSFELYGEIGEPINVRIEIERSEIYDLQKCFGITYGRRYAVHANIPVDKMLSAKKGLAFYIRMNGLVQKVKLRFSRMGSRLYSSSDAVYWRFAGDRYLLYEKRGRLLVCESSSRIILGREYRLFKEMKDDPDGEGDAFCIKLRLLYWLTRPYYKNKRIWIAFDKLYKAGDNGEYFYQYCKEQKDGIDCYYVINRNASERDRLRKQHGHKLLYANSLRCRLLALHAEAILSTHPATPNYLGFIGSWRKWFRNIYQAEHICIQHGLTINQIAQYQNRIYDNTKLYCCASLYEIENVAEPIYGYRREELKLTGLARYDGLKNREIRQILITPTWRRGFFHAGVAGKKREYNPLFKKSAYFRIYNSLINDRELISCAKATGYRIIFLLHPVMSAQINDYEKNDYVELLQTTEGVSYEEMLTEASLMVTDYSGVQFDFAYQRKPLIYYHPVELPPQYKESGMIYETMGFGPICTEQEQLVKVLCEYMREGCHMKDEYKRRADQFFAYDDFHNCERIYQEVRGYCDAIRNNERK